jgi:hypothetical protein
MLSIITFYIQINDPFSSVEVEALAHLEVCWVCCVPTPRTSNDRIKPSRQDTGKSINRCFGGLVIRISNNTLPNASGKNHVKGGDPDTHTASSATNASLMKPTSCPIPALALRDRRAVLADSC